VVAATSCCGVAAICVGIMVTSLRGELVVDLFRDIIA